ncbi:MAG TPA: HupE/UreJ family protein [Stellaceae bacterium]|jgi:hydrogenase/urease accessory protein HupE
MAVFAFIGAAVGCIGTARAHQINWSSARIETMADSRAVDVEIAMKGSDVDHAAGTNIVDADSGMVRADALAAAAPTIAAYVTARAVIVNADGDAACRPGPPTVAPDGDGIVVRVRWSCGDTGGGLRYRSTILTDVDSMARQAVLIRDGGGERNSQALLDARETEIPLAVGERPTVVQVVARYLVSGIEHIFLGYDHIAFLIAIVLWARRLWPVVKIVTAFTVAHSITLSLAALDIVRIPNGIAEPAIAASIVYVAIENFLSRDVERRWRIAFAFGLIHGFGFAAALQEFSPPKDALVTALASFNLGVEAGQIAIVSLALPALRALDCLLSTPAAAVPVRTAVAVYVISAGIGVLGGYWLLERTLLT